MNVEKKVPAIRFQGFSGEWDKNSVGLLCDFIVPGRTKPQIFNGVIPWVTTPDITSNCVSKSKIGLAISKEEAKRVGAKIVPKNSIIISCVGDLGLVAKADNELIINQQLHAFIPKENINKWFLLYELLTRKKYMENVATKTAVPYMNKDNCNSIPIAFPSIEEQTAIGSTFQKLDSLINQHQQKHDKLSNIKKAMLEKMFPKQGETTPEIRFKGFSGEWEVKPLSEVAEVIDPHPSHRAPDAVVNGVPFIGIGDISDSGLVDFKNVRIVPLHIYNEHTARYTIENGDFAYGRVASVGKIIDLSNNVGNKYTYSPTMAIVKPKSLRPSFLKSYLGTDVFKAHVDNKTSGSTRKSLGVQDFRNLPVLFPLVDEQTAIGNYFKKFDTLINQHQQQITKLNNIKQACLSKMFV